MNRVGIIGFGVVGSALYKLFPDALIYDPFKGQNDEGTLSAEYIFVAVPTPLKDGKLDCSIVEKVIEKCSRDSVIIIRSAVNPGLCDSFEERGWNLVYQVEYLGETVAHPLLNENNSQFIVIGGRPESRRKVIELYQTVYNANLAIRQVTSLEAEVIKLSENRAIAFKMMQCQELFDACEAHGVDYYTVQQAVYGDDPRFNLWWTFVYPNNRGFNSSKCLLKDVPAWSSWAKSGGSNTEVTDVLIKRSNDYAISNNCLKK